MPISVKEVLSKILLDTEKPETLEELDVVQEDLVEVTELKESPGRFLIKITFVPTVPKFFNRLYSKVR